MGNVIQNFGQISAELREINNESIKNELIENATIPERTQEKLDKTVIDVFQQDDTAIKALRDNGLVNTSLQPYDITYTENSNATQSEATQSMEYQENSNMSDYEFKGQTFPVPVTHASGRIGVRQYDAANNKINDFDSSLIRPLAYSVRDKVNESIMKGNSKLVINTSKLQGITNHSGRKTISNLDGAYATTPANSVSDFAKIISGYSDLGTNAPGILLLSFSDYATLSANTESGTTMTYLDRMLAHPIVKNVVPDAEVPDGNMILVEARPRTIELGTAMNETSLINLNNNSILAPKTVYVYTIMVPLIHKIYRNGKAQVNIVHGSTS